MRTTSVVEFPIHHFNFKKLTARGAAVALLLTCVLLSFSNVAEAGVYHTQHLVDFRYPEYKTRCTRWFERWGVKTCIAWGKQTRTTTIKYEFRVIGPDNPGDAIIGTIRRAIRNCTALAIGTGHSAGMAATGGTGGVGAGAYPAAFWGAAKGTWLGCLNSYEGWLSGVVDARIVKDVHTLDWH